MTGTLHGGRLLMPLGHEKAIASHEQKADPHAQYWNDIRGLQQVHDLVVGEAEENLNTLEKVGSALLDKLNVADYKPLGEGQLWRHVSRSKGVTYTNEAGRTITVVINGISASAALAYVSIIHAGISFRSETYGNSGGVPEAMAIIPPGGTYTFAWYNLSHVYFFELR